jgi:hypothetical protein
MVVPAIRLTVTYKRHAVSSLERSHLLGLHANGKQQQHN